MKTITLNEINNWKEPVVESSIVHGSELVTDLIKIWNKDPKEVTGFPTRWPIFNQAFGGARPGEVIVITGDSGSGKTTFATSWLLDTVRNDRPAFFISLEMSREAIAAKIASMVGQGPMLGLSTPQRAFVIECLQRLPLFYYDAKETQQDLFLFKAIQYAAFEKKCRFVVLDHLEYVRKTGEYKQDESSAIRDFMCRLEKIAQRTETTILLIAHPSKLQNKGQEREVGMDELKGSSSIKQEADAVMSIFNTEAPGEMIVRFLKIRSDHFSINRRAFIRFHWDPVKFLHSEISNKIEKGNP